MDLKHFTRVLLPPQITSTFYVFLSSYRNTSGGLGEREMMFPQLFRVLPNLHEIGTLILYLVDPMWIFSPRIW